VFDIARITERAHAKGCVVGWDLAHAAGNIPLQLHDWNVNFAAWCLDLPRYAGWWGNDPATRFRMQLQPGFVPREGADGWQISNPPILAMAPLVASLELFDRATMPALREKSIKLTGYLRWLLERIDARGRFEIVTPRETEACGCQLSLLVHDRPKHVLEALSGRGVVCDFREPNVIRVAPTPMYNTFHNVWRFARILEGCLA
jgi:kynureninase